MMRGAHWLALALLLVLSACAPPQQVAARRPAPQSWTAVLVAGDGELPVFDNATGQMAELLHAVGTPAGEIRRFSASPDVLALPRVQLASKARVLDAIAAMRPAPGTACLVFMTSHGAHGPGLFLAPHDEFLTPTELDAALQAGCGAAPTVAIVSACYTGAFARPPMAQPNRVVLTAAAADRASFGCGAGQRYAVFDECLLKTLGSLPRDWSGVIADTGTCVSQREAQDHERPSMPQSAIGSAAEAVPVPG